MDLSLCGKSDRCAFQDFGLFSAKCYNLESLTVGRTEDPTISRMTIETHCDEETFEQIKKQLNRMVEVIKVIDFTDLSVCMKEILYVKIKRCSLEDKTELFQIAETFKAEVIDYGKDSMLLEFLQTATKNDAVVKLLKEEFKMWKSCGAEASELKQSVWQSGSRKIIRIQKKQSALLNFFQNSLILEK